MPIYLDTDHAATNSSDLDCRSALLAPWKLWTGVGRDGLLIGRSGPSCSCRSGPQPGRHQLGAELTMGATLGGVAEPQFAAIARALEASLSAGHDLGASVCVYHRGREVVNISGGQDPVRMRAYTPRTLQVVFSATKAATTLCLLRLVEDRKIDLDQSVAHYWPEFASSGKATIPVRWVASHKAALPIVRDGGRLGRSAFLGVTDFVAALAAEAPWWEPGSAYGYHALSYGYLIGELVRRVTGMSIGSYFQREIAAPLGLRFWIGLPEEHEYEVAPNLYDDHVRPTPPFQTGLAAAVSASLVGLFEYDPSSGQPLDALYNTRPFRSTENPSANGVTSARDLARMYAAMTGMVDGSRMVSNRTLDRALDPQTDGLEDVLAPGSGRRFGIGFMLPSEGLPLLSRSSFGHPGSGGALAFADREHEVAFAYVPNRMVAGHDRRAAWLIDALRECVGI